MAHWPYRRNGGVHETHRASWVGIGGHWRALAGVHRDPVGANEIAELKAQIEALQERLAKIEAAQKKAEKTAVTAGETGGFKLPGSNTSISIGSYVKGDFYLDNRNDRGHTFDVTSIRLDDEPEGADDDGDFGVHAQQSRLRFDTHTPTGMGALNTRIETDFNPYGSAQPRLRQAYGALGPVLAGQAWSILGDDHTGANTVDFDGPVGIIATTRKPQLRLTLPMGEGFYGQMAVEPPLTGNELPTFLAAARYSAGWGAVNLTGAAGRNDVEGQNASAHALHVGASFNVADGTRVMATYNMTKGFTGRIWGAGDGTAMVDGDLKAQTSMGGFAGVTQSWSDTISSGLYFGWVENDTADGVSALDAAGENKALQTLHANVFWSPVPQASIGFEVMHGWREVNAQANDAGDAIDPAKKTEGEATRVQLGVQYSF